MDQAKSGGRENQKARTRTALLESAAALIRDGHRPTVEEAALAIGVSKRTAYRYFVSQDHMLADAALEALRSRMDTIFAETSAPEDVHARVAALAVALRRLAETHDAELRVMMRAALDRGGDQADGEPTPRARGRRRLDWIEAALSPVRERLSQEAYGRLVNSLAVCVGVDALMVLRDVCGLTGAAAEEIMVSMANAILDRALAQADGG